METKHVITIGYSVSDLKGVGHELLLGKVTGETIGEFLSGVLFPSLSDTLSSDIKTHRYRINPVIFITN